MSKDSRRYHITTFGCQMNKADSERMAGILEKMGFEWAEVPDDANLILYNTCTIRDNAEQKVYSYLGRQAKRKQEQPDLTLIVAGCVAQQEGEELLRKGRNRKKQMEVQLFTASITTTITTTTTTAVIWNPI